MSPVDRVGRWAISPTRSMKCRSVKQFVIYSDLIHLGFKPGDLAVIKLI